MQTALLWCKERLNKGTRIFPACEYLFRSTLSVTTLRTFPVNKNLENLDEFSFLQNSHLCT